MSCNSPALPELLSSCSFQENIKHMYYLRFPSVTSALNAEIPRLIPKQNYLPTGQLEFGKTQLLERLVERQMQLQIAFAFLKRTEWRGQPKIPTVPNEEQLQDITWLCASKESQHTEEKVPRHSSMAGAPAEPSPQQILGSQAGAKRDAPHEELHGPGATRALPELGDTEMRESLHKQSSATIPTPFYGNDSPGLSAWCLASALHEGKRE